MELIPVIDLLHGQAVLACQGRRDQYRPLTTSLCPGSDPLEVIAAYLTLAPFRRFYIADIDAIEKTGDNGIIIDSVRRAFPALTFWIDRGWPPVCRQANQIPVIGSESLENNWRENLSAMNEPWILSLDFDADRLRGPSEILEEAGLWPRTVILMSLSRVGGECGPDWHRLSHFINLHPNRHWIASGGIRQQQDLSRLERMGIGQALVASALHRGTLIPGETKEKSRHPGGSGLLR